jgi:hypothetical protein
MAGQRGPEELGRREAGRDAARGVPGGPTTVGRATTVGGPTAVGRATAMGRAATDGQWAHARLRI